MTPYPWIVLAVALFALLLLGFVLYHFYTDPAETYPLAMFTVMISLSVSFLCTLLIPIDIYVISEGDITSETLHVRVSREMVQTAYLTLFSSMLIVAFFLVPYAYFYGEERGDIGDELDRFMRAKSALRSTGFFVSFVIMLFFLGLNFRPGHTESLNNLDAVKWVDDLLDVDHGGLNAVSFCIACITCLGLVGWAFYTAYGMAVMPFDWLRRRQSATEQRQELESSIAVIREKHRRIQSKYAEDPGGNLDLARVKAADRKELNKLQREQKHLSHYNYQLQELEQKAGTLIPQLLLFLVPFRFMVGVVMLCTSLLVAGSMALTLGDRMVHSTCGWSCGFAMSGSTYFNPTDEILLYFSHWFPLDFIVLGFLVLYAFGSSLYGVVSLGLRILCFQIFTLKPRKSQPQALLMLCNVLSHILLAMCTVLLTLAPDYTSFGVQAAPVGTNVVDHRCSLEKNTDELVGSTRCQISVISKFFTRIAIAMPLFPVLYFFANTTFVLVFSVFFLRLALQDRPELVDTTHDEIDEEEVGLLSLS